MAVLHDQVLGKVRGSVQDLTFSLRKHVNYFYTKPRNKTLPMDEASVFRRNQFGFIGKLSQAIYQTPLLRISWDKTKTEKTWCTYDDIFKINYRAIKYNDPNGIPVLFPDTSVKLKHLVVQKTPACYDIHSDGIGTMDNFDLLNCESIILIGICFFANPGSPEDPAKVNVSSFSIQLSIPDLLSPFNIKVNPSEYAKFNFNDDLVIKAFFTIAFLDDKKLPLSFSEIISENNT